VVGSQLGVGPFVEVGRQIFDGEGNTTATATASLNGKTLPPLTLRGKYTVNADCTGSLTLEVSPVNVRTGANFVITDAGREFRAIVTDEGVALTVVGKKQFADEE
jgi:hypothetical protein